MKGREQIDEQYEDNVRLEGKSTGEYCGKYHIARGDDLLATIIASEHVAQQIVRAINEAGPLYYYKENIPKDKAEVLGPTDREPGYVDVSDLLTKTRSGTL